MLERPFNVTPFNVEADLDVAWAGAPLQFHDYRHWRGVGRRQVLRTRYQARQGHR